MAGSRKGNRGSSKRAAPEPRSAAKNRAADRPAGEYAREAVTEWGKAVRYAASALRPSSDAIRERLTDRSARGGRVGKAADALLAKMGKPGKAASKLGVGSRLVERMRPGNARSGEASSNGEGPSDGDGTWESGMPIPIQESIEVAVPVRVAYDVCRSFDEYPEFIDRIESVEEVGDDSVVFEAKVRGARRRIEVQIADERPNRRIDWRADGAVAHSGVVTFHELAPSLTHIELTIDLEPQDLLQRITRAAHLTERAIRADMHRFKAYAELWEEEEGEEDEDVEPEAEEAEEPEAEAAPDDEELEDEEQPEAEAEPDDEEPVDEEQPEDEEELDEYTEDEESEPVEAG